MSQANERLECKIVSARAFHTLAGPIPKPTSARDLILSDMQGFKLHQWRSVALFTTNSKPPKAYPPPPADPRVYIGRHVGSSRGETLEELCVTPVYSGLLSTEPSISGQKRARYHRAKSLKWWRILGPRIPQSLQFSYRSNNMGQLRGRYLHWAVTAASCQAFLLLGYDQGVMSGLVGADNQFGETFNNPDSTMQGLLTSIYDIGCAVGCLLSLVIGHRFGRRKMIMAGGSIMIIGTIILGSSYTTAQFLVGRIVTGLGNGINSSTVPAYQSELARPELRGMLLSAQGTVTILGLCIAYWLDYGLSFVDTPVQWRFPISFQAFFAVFLVLQMIPLPDSPRWLCEQDRSDEAASVLARLQVAQPANESHPDVVHLRRQIESSIEIESAGGPFKYKELWSGGQMGNLRRMILAAVVNIQQQFTGSNMINYYAPIVYQNAMHLSRNLSLILGGCTSLAYLVGSIIPLWSMDKFGRRASLMFSAAGLCFCFVMTAILLSIGTTPCAYAATVFVFVFQLFLGIGYLPVPWFYPSEISTTRIRARAQAFGGFVNWICVFIVVQVTPTAIDNIGWRTFIIFACFCFAWIPMVYFFFPETKGLELEDVDHLFEKGGITGGVFESRGFPVYPGYHRTMNAERIEKQAETETTHVEV